MNVKDFITQYFKQEYLEGNLKNYWKFYSDGFFLSENQWDCLFKFKEIYGIEFEDFLKNYDITKINEWCYSKEKELVTNFLRHKSPCDFDLLNDIGVNCAKYGMFEEAKGFWKFIELASYYRAYGNLGIMSMIQHRYEDALKLFERTGEIIRILLEIKLSEKNTLEQHYLQTLGFNQWVDSLCMLREGILYEAIGSSITMFGVTAFRKCGFKKYENYLSFLGEFLWYIEDIAKLYKESTVESFFKKAEEAIQELDNILAKNINTVDLRLSPQYPIVFALSMWLITIVQMSEITTQPNLDYVKMLFKNVQLDKWLVFLDGLEIPIKRWTALKNAYGDKVMERIRGKEEFDILDSLWKGFQSFDEPEKQRPAKLSEEEIFGISRKVREEIKELTKKDGLKPEKEEVVDSIYIGTGTIPTPGIPSGGVSLGLNIKLGPLYKKLAKPVEFFKNLIGKFKKHKSRKLKE